MLVNFKDGLRMARFNGWQRLWVVGCIALAMFTGWYAAEALPEESRTTYYHESRIRQLTGYLKEAIARRGGVVEGDEYIDGLQDSIREENENYPKALAAIPDQRRSELVAALGIWLGLSLGLYVAGWLVGWIYRGFRPKKSGS